MSSVLTITAHGVGVNCTSKHFSHLRESLLYQIGLVSRRFGASVFVTQPLLVMYKQAMTSIRLLVSNCMLAGFQFSISFFCYLMISDWVFISVSYFSLWSWFTDLTNWLASLFNFYHICRFGGFCCFFRHCPEYCYALCPKCCKGYAQ